MKQLFFLLECNLSPLQPVLRGAGHSVYLPIEPEINVPFDAPDPVIIARITEQKESLGVDRILVTRDLRLVKHHLGKSPIKVIVILDKTNRYDIMSMRLNDLCNAIITTGSLLMAQSPDQAIGYLELSKFYKSS